MDTVNIFDVPVNLLTKRQLVDEIISHSSGPEKSIIGHVNSKGLNLAYEEEKFSHFFHQCDLVYCDGFGPLLGAKILGYNVSKKYRNTCPDFLDLLLTKLEAQQKKIFFLGGTRQVLDRLDSMMEEMHPSLDYQGYHGFFKKKGKENEIAIKKINTFKPDILYVGFGMPLQEYWILDNMDAVNTRVFLPEGACLDFYTDTVYRAPDFLTNNGLEWLIRLLTEPSRLWKRYLIGNPVFLARVLKDKFFT